MNLNMQVQDKNKIFVKSLNLVDSIQQKDLENELGQIECLLCDIKFDISTKIELDSYLAHLLKQHRFVISDVDNIGHFNKYNSYWKDRLKNLKVEDVCFKINTNTGANDKGAIETYYLLCDNFPEDLELRKKLNIYKLKKAITQLESERNDTNYFKKCLFCAEIIGNNRTNLLKHMSNDHNFKIGNADNIVYFDEMYEKLNERLENLKCLYCEKVFYDKLILKEHMRKKQHKCINPKNTEFDRFYIINYLEYSKIWKDIKQENDHEESKNEGSECSSIEDWNDPVQTFFCLFCDKFYENEDEILNHMLDAHKFDLKSLKSFSFYNQVKIINYLRRQIYMNNCFICTNNFQSKAELLKHLEDSNHIKHLPKVDQWDQPEYLFSIFEDDSLLCLLDDEGYSKDEARVKVIPENFNLKPNEELINFNKTD